MLTLYIAKLELMLSVARNSIKFTLSSSADCWVQTIWREAEASTVIALVERQIYYNNNTAQHSLIWEEIIETERN